MDWIKYSFGDLLEQTHEENSGLKYGPEDVRGMTITKEIIDTKARTEYADLQKFIIVHPNEFIYNPRTHGKKIGLGYNNTDKSFLISWNNIAFKIKDEAINIVDPEYLYLHFIRPEWDREACYRALGSSTEVFAWETFERMTIFLPTLEEQKDVVKKIKVITDRIKVLTDINQKLEETARTLFKEFYCNKPKNVGLGDIIQECPKSKVQVGTARQCNGGLYPFFTSGAEILVYDQFLTDGRKILLNTGGRADIKFHVGKAAYSTDTWCIKAKDNLTDYLFLVLCDMKAAIDDEYFNGSALRHLQKPKFKTIKIYKPTDTELENLNKVFIPVFNIVAKNNEEIQKLTELKDVLLPKLMTGDVN